MSGKSMTPRSARVFPALAVRCFLLASWLGLGGSLEASSIGLLFAAVLLPILLGAVFAAVRHAEVIAHRTGEPYGTLVLTVAVTAVEVALIASIMLGSESRATLARDIVFAAVMIVRNGLVGLCILVRGRRCREPGFRVTGVSAYPHVRHRDCFIVLNAPADDEAPHLPSNRTVAVGAVLPVVSPAAVILLAKKFAAVQAARRDELQKSLNLALGSSLATIGMRIPAVAAASILLRQKLCSGSRRGTRSSSL